MRLGGGGEFSGLHSLRSPPYRAKRGPALPLLQAAAHREYLADAVAELGRHEIVIGNFNWTTKLHKFFNFINKSIFKLKLKLCSSIISSPIWRIYWKLEIGHWKLLQKFPFPICDQPILDQLVGNKLTVFHVQNTLGMLGGIGFMSDQNHSMP